MFGFEHLHHVVYLVMGSNANSIITESWYHQSIFIIH